MKNFIIYDSAGNILRVGRCPAEMMVIQAIQTGESVIEGTANDATDIVDTVNKVVLKNVKMPAP